MLLRIAACAILLVFAPLPCSAQEWARKMFAESRHDFGSVARAGKAVYAFELTNLYQEDVHISSVRSSCGCTTPKIAKDTLKTYEKGAIVCTFNTRTFRGQRSATVTVTFDKPFFAQVQLQVQGYIRSDVVLTPGGVEFGNVDSGQPIEKKLGIAYAGRSTWKIVEVKSPSEYIEARVEEKTRAGGQIEYDLHVKLRDDAPAGFIREQLILVTNDQRSREVPIEVQGRVMASVTVSPGTLFMGALRPGEKVTKQVVIQAKKPFKVTSVDCDDCFEFKTPDAAKPVHVIPVTFVAGGEPGKKTYKIKITTDLGEETVSELSAYAQVLQPAAAP